MDVIKEDQVLDCSGMLCPMPVVKTSKTIKAMEIGQVLKMVATDPGAPPDMEAWSRQTGRGTSCSARRRKMASLFSTFDGISNR